ncbi:Diacylglycerol kinase [compost metagenome]
MKYLHFIVNPIAGKAKHHINASMLLPYFPKDQFRIEVSYTEYKNHAKHLAARAAAHKADCIIACGGDGTINEVAGEIVNTDIALGIIPVGSGNGLASNFGIPKEIAKAIAIIQKQTLSYIDVGTINEHYFFSNTGIGIDAAIIKRYERSSKRTLMAYIKASLASSLSFKLQETIVRLNNKEINVKPFLLFVSNSNEMGYNMSLTPKASLTDGWLDVVILEKINFLEKLRMGFHVLTSSIARFKKAKHNLVKQLEIHQPERIFTDVQIDGEYHNLKTNKITISLLHKSLKVIVPD